MEGKSRRMEGKRRKEGKIETSGGRRGERKEHGKR